MMANTKRIRGKNIKPHIFSFLMLGILFIASFSLGDITGRIQSVDGKTVRIVVEGGMMPEIGAKVKISDEVEGVGLVPLMGTWKVTAIEEDVVVAQTGDPECGTPLPGYTAAISGEGGVGAKPQPDTGPSPEGGRPAVEIKPSPEVKREPPRVGGGGGTIAVPKAAWPFIVLAGLAAGIIILALTIGALRRAGSSQITKVRATLDVYYADGGQKTFVIDKERISIGRGEDNDLVLKDYGVSSRHAEIVASTKGFVLNDLGSTNGTFLNKKKISEALIYAGDKILMGSTTLSFRS